MSNHIHVMIAFRSSDTSIGTLIANGKRFMAYELVKKLKAIDQKEILALLASYLTKTEKLKNQKHVVFEPSFDRKECFDLTFMKQKIDYIHTNPCKGGLVKLPEDYEHSSARYYYTGQQGRCPVITYMELQDIDLTIRMAE